MKAFSRKLAKMARQAQQVFYLVEALEELYSAVGVSKGLLEDFSIVCSEAMEAGTVDFDSILHLEPK